jgi:hypothetical protein
MVLPPFKQRLVLHGLTWKCIAKSEVRVRETTPSEALEAKRREEFKRLSRLNENLARSDQEIWEMVA